MPMAGSQNVWRHFETCQARRNREIRLFRWLAGGGLDGAGLFLRVKVNFRRHCQASTELLRSCAGVVVAHLPRGASAMRLSLSESSFAFAAFLWSAATNASASLEGGQMSVLVAVVRVCVAC